MSAASVDLSIIIVSYNTSDLLRACLASVERSAEARGAPICETIVVDNRSTDGSCDMVRAAFARVHLIESDNVGFAAGNNKGIAVAGGRYILLLNPDTVVLDDALAVLVRFMDAHAQAGAAGGHLLNPDGSLQHCAFRFPTLSMSFIDFYNLNHRVLNSRLNGRYPLHTFDRDFQIDHPLGACLLVRRVAMEQAGLLDEGYFMYCEEIDWCLRIKRAGWQIWHVAAARVVHYGGQSTGQFRQRMFVELHRSRARFFRIYRSALFCAANRWVVRLGLARDMVRAWWAHRGARISDADYTERMAAYHAVWRL